MNNDKLKRELAALNIKRNQNFINPPIQNLAQTSTTQVSPSINPKLNIGGAMPVEKAEVPGIVDFIKKSWNRYSNNGQDRTLLGVASNFIPYYEQYVDVKDVATGLISGDKEKMNSGILGMAAPVAGKAVLSGMDYIAEKVIGKKAADEMATRRNDIVNMSERELSEGFNKFGGWGWYDNWVKAGKPKL
jgi:hypothetical protein